MPGSLSYDITGKNCNSPHYWVLVSDLGFLLADFPGKLILLPEMKPHFWVLVSDLGFFLADFPGKVILLPEMSPHFWVLVSDLGFF